MDVFDKISKKIGYRKLSYREKILFSVLILLLIQLVIYYFFIRPKNKIYSEKLSNYENLKNNEESFDYSGFKDFSKENLSLIESEMGLGEGNFSREQSSNSEILSIFGETDLENILKTQNFSKYYGYSTININREGENKFSYNFKAIKPFNNIYYSDLKSSYFGEDKKEEKVEIQDNKKGNIEIKNTKKAPKKTQAKQVSNQKKAEKKQDRPKNIENIIAPIDIIEKKEEPRKIEEIVVENLEKNKKVKEEFNEFAISTSSENVQIDNIRNIMSVINIKDPKEERIIIGLDRICGEISFSFLLINHIKEFGFVNTEEEFIPYDENLLLKTWTGVNFKNDNNISAFYIIPYDGVETSMYIGEFTYYEEI